MSAGPAAAIERLEQVAHAAGLDPRGARAEGRRLAAAVVATSAPSAVPEAWVAAMGGTLVDFYDDAARGRRYANGPTPLLAGLATLPFTAALMGAVPTSVRMLDRLGPRRQLVIGPLISALGTAWLARLSVDGSYWIDVLPGVIGLGLGVLMLILDFDFVERGIEAGLPERESWRAAFGLTVTIIWIYIELLRLLAILRGND